MGIKETKMVARNGYRITPGLLREFLGLRFNTAAKENDGGQLTAESSRAKEMSSKVSCELFP